MDLESKSRSSPQRVIVAVLCGCAMGALTSQVGWIADISNNAIIGVTQKGLMTLILPGMFGAMFLNGNIHDFSLWAAAAINAVVYFGLALAVYRLGESIVGRMKPAG